MGGYGSIFPKRMAMVAMSLMSIFPCGKPAVGPVMSHSGGAGGHLFFPIHIANHVYEG